MGGGRGQAVGGAVVLHALLRGRALAMHACSTALQRAGPPRRAWEYRLAALAWHWWKTMRSSCAGAPLSATDLSSRAVKPERSLGSNDRKPRRRQAGALPGSCAPPGCAPPPAPGSSTASSTRDAILNSWLSSCSVCRRAGASSASVSSWGYWLSLRRQGGRAQRAGVVLGRQAGLSGAVKAARRPASAPLPPPTAPGRAPALAVGAVQQQLAGGEFGVLWGRRRAGEGLWAVGGHAGAHKPGGGGGG